MGQMKDFQVGNRLHRHFQLNRVVGSAAVPALAVATASCQCGCRFRAFHTGNAGRQFRRQQAIVSGLRDQFADRRHADDYRGRTEAAGLQRYPPRAQPRPRRLRNQPRNSSRAMLYTLFVIGDETLSSTSVFSFCHPGNPLNCNQIGHFCVLTMGIIGIWTLPYSFFARQVMV
jgi:hypothetical protein